MREYDLKKLLNDSQLLDQKIEEYQNNNILFKQNIDKNEIEGHLLKADHNLRFISKILTPEFLDWAITGCYYSCYHAALALIMTKGYTSKNHLATLSILIKEFYNNELNQEDIEIISTLLDYQDVLFYVESKNKRENATYSTKLKFNEKEVQQLKLKSIFFVNKIKEIIEEK